MMRTLAAATLITTSDLSTPAVVATFACRLALSLSEKASTLPLTIISTRTVPVEGGVGGEGGGGGGGGGVGGCGEGGGGEGGGGVGGCGEGGGGEGGGGEGGRRGRGGRRGDGLRLVRLSAIFAIQDVR